MYVANRRSKLLTVKLKQRKLFVTTIKSLIVRTFKCLVIALSVDLLTSADFCHIRNGILSKQLVM